MNPKPPPRIAMWLLKHLGSGPNNDSILGDLAEGYGKRNSTMWYWRQALKAIPVCCIREVQGGRIPITRAVGITLLTLSLIAALWSDIDPFWNIPLAAVLGGVFVGVLMFLRGNRQESLESLAISNLIGDVRIDSSKIPIRGGIGTGVLILVLLSGVLVELPELRLVAALAIFAGIVFGVLLFWWRKHHA